MPYETTLSDEPDTIETGDVSHVEIRQLYKEDIARALAIIARDSNVQPEHYLAVTTVPYGGE
jgi:hypothetical protein